MRNGKRRVRLQAEVAFAALDRQQWTVLIDQFDGTRRELREFEDQDWPPLGEIGVRPASATLVVAGECGERNVALAVDWIIDVDELENADAAESVNADEVAAAAAPSDPCPNHAAGLQLGLDGREANRGRDHVIQIQGPGQRLFEVPRHIAGRRHGRVAAIGTAEFGAGYLALRPSAQEPV